MADRVKLGLFGATGIGVGAIVGGGILAQLVLPFPRQVRRRLLLLRSMA